MAKRGGLKAKVTSLKTLVTPDGIAAYPKLRKPEDPFDRGIKKFEITVGFNREDPKFKAFVKVLAELNRKYLIDMGENPPKKLTTPKCIKVADKKLVEKIGWAIGTPYMKFEAIADAEETPIPVFGSDGKPTRTSVFGTDLVSVETRIVGWQTGNGLGIKGYLAAVQLLESRWRSDAGSGFGVREEYIQSDDDSDDAEVEEPDESGLVEEDAPFEDDASGTEEDPSTVEAEAEEDDPSQGLA